MNADRARQVVAEASAILVDFDGPICSVFAGVPGSEVAQALRAELAADGVPWPLDAQQTDDPLDVIRWFGLQGTPEQVSIVEELLIAHELEAVKSAAPTPGAKDFIKQAAGRGQLLAVVSNNSAAAVLAYLEQRQLLEHFSVVIGRPGDPACMKPHPYPLQAAAQQLNVPLTSCVLIGDSLTDLEAARTAGTRCVAFANRTGKVAAFQARLPEAVITTMQDLLA